MAELATIARPYADALFKAGKDFELLPLSGFTHMVPDAGVTTRLQLGWHAYERAWVTRD